MKKIFSAVSVQIMLVTFSFFDCRAQQQINANLEEAKKSIAASNEIYFQAFAKGDSSIMINRYAKDCWIMSANMPALCGEEASLDFFRIVYYQKGIRNGKFITIDIFGEGKEFVTELGFWELFDANHQISDTGKYLVLWKKTEDGWKMYRDSFSSDRNENMLK